MAGTRISRSPGQAEHLTWVIVDPASGKHLLERGAEREEWKERDLGVRRRANVVVELTPGQRCPLCHAAHQPASAGARCDACGAAFHVECAREAGRCASRWGAPARRAGWTR